MNRSIISMAILSVAINSFSLTFSKNFIVTGSNYRANSDTLTLYNNSNDIITIDTIFEEVKINGKKSQDYAEISFEILGTDSLYYYNWILSLNDSVFYTYLESNGHKLTIKANDSISLHNFIFGRCIWCVNSQETFPLYTDTFDITLRFKYHNTLTDSIVFHGPGSFFYDVAIQPRNSSKNVTHNQNINFDLLGRVYKEMTIKNNLRILKSFSKKQNSIILDK